MKGLGVTETMEDRVLAFIKRYIAERGYPPSMREIGENVGIASTQVVSDRLRRLESEGRLSVTPRVSRGLRVL